MKPYRILKDFAGNQTGNGQTEYFKAGTVRDLTDHLAEVVLKEKWVEPVAAQVPAPPQDPVIEVEGILHAEARETKVVEPEETKTTKPLAKMSKAELVTHALDTYGMELVPDTMTVKQMIAAIEEQASKTAA